jgi:hypothetical protein
MRKMTRVPASRQAIERIPPALEGIQDQHLIENLFDASFHRISVHACS